MRVDGPRSTAEIRKAGKASKANKSARKQGSGDRIQVADAASLRERAKVLLAETPDVRLDRIEAIRESLERGTFQMDDRETAVRIVINAMAERSW